MIVPVLKDTWGNEAKDSIRYYSELEDPVAGTTSLGIPNIESGTYFVCVYVCACVCACVCVCVCVCAHVSCGCVCVCLLHSNKPYILLQNTLVYRKASSKALCRLQWYIHCHLVVFFKFIMATTYFIGYCSKMYAIVKRAATHEELVNKSWLVITDDDTLLR